MLLVIAVSFLVFCLMYMLPGDPVDMVVDRKVSAERKAEIAHELGYDQPFVTRYVSFLKGVVTKFDFGTSYRTRDSVLDDILTRIPISFKLASFSILLAI